MEGMLFLGTAGNVEPVQRRSWRLPFYIGTSILIAYAIYDAVKLHYLFTSPSTVYVNYGAEMMMRVVNDTAIATMLLLVVSVTISFLVRASFGSMKTSRVYWFLIVIAEIMLVTSVILATMRFIIDARIYASSTLPWHDVWIYRFMDDMTIILEWDAIPDIFLNGALILAIIMIMASLIELHSEVNLHENIMETGMDVTGETVSIGNEKFDLDCKIKNGIKACKVK